MSRSIELQLFIVYKKEGRECQGQERDFDRQDFLK